jgi:hypothetical protein
LHFAPDDHHLEAELPSLHRDSEMIDDEKIQSHLTNGGPSYFDMDEAFCARMRAAIEAGLEHAPIGVVTTPGTKKPKYVLPEQWSLVSSPGAMDF